MRDQRFGIELALGNELQRFLAVTAVLDMQITRTDARKRDLDDGIPLVLYRRLGLLN